MGQELPRAFGPYVLWRFLGAGAYGQVFLALPLDEDSELPSPLVIKALRSERRSDRIFVERFKHEAQVAVRLNSVHIAQVYDVGAIGEDLYIAMEYIPGRPLAKVYERLRAKQRYLPAEEAVAICSGGLRALADLHRANDPSTGEPLRIIHRDVSPKNLIVSKDDGMKLIDLGVGKSELQEWKTRTGLIVGSPGYMAPEQVLGHPVDQSIDLYAMAIVVYELLTLRRYIPRGSMMETLQASAHPSFVAPSKLREGVPDALDRVLERALAHDPANRYSNADALLYALEEAVGTVREDTVARLEIEPEQVTQPQIEELRTQIQRDPREAQVFARRDSSALRRTRIVTVTPTPAMLPPPPLSAPSLSVTALPRPGPSGLGFLAVSVSAVAALLVGALVWIQTAAKPPIVELIDPSAETHQVPKAHEVHEPHDRPAAVEPAQAVVVPREAPAIDPPRAPDPRDPSDPPRVKKPRRRAASPLAPPPAPPRRTPSAPPKRTLERLETRAQQASSRVPAKDKLEAHRLLADIAMEKAANGGEGETERLDRLEARVVELEKRARAE